MIYSKIIREIVRVVRQFFNLPIKLYYLCKDTYEYFYFPNAFVAFRGKFATFNKAMDSRPKNNRYGYFELLSPDFNDILNNAPNLKIDLREYPTFYFLYAISYTLKDNPLSIVDFGGGYGEHYFSFTNAIKKINSNALSNIQWQVIEIPSNVEMGNKIAKALNLNNIHFTTSLFETSKHNVFIASGSLQYVENIFDLLKKYMINDNGGGVEHIITSRVFLQNKTDTFVSLQNAKNKFYMPVYFFNEVKFIDFFVQFGYQVVCDWYNPFDCANDIIPYNRNINIYSKGFYFRKLIK